MQSPYFEPTAKEIKRCIGGNRKGGGGGVVIVLCSLELLCLHEICLASLTFVPKRDPRSRHKLIKYATLLAIRDEQTIR